MGRLWRLEVTLPPWEDMRPSGRLEKESRRLGPAESSSSKTQPELPGNENQGETIGVISAVVVGGGDGRGVGGGRCGAATFNEIFHGLWQAASCKARFPGQERDNTGMPPTRKHRVANVSLTTTKKHQTPNCGEVCDVLERERDGHPKSPSPHLQR